MTYTICDSTVNLKTKGTILYEKKRIDESFKRKLEKKI